MINKLTLDGDPNKAVDTGLRMNNADKFIPLSAEEKSKLLSLRVNKLLVSLAFVLQTFILLAFFYYELMSNTYGEVERVYYKLNIVFLLPMLIILCIPLGIISFMLNKYRKLSKDAKEGIKQVIVAPVEAKKNSRAKVFFSSYYYYLWFNKRKIVLEGWQYHQYEVGDLAELHIAPHSNIVFGDSIKKYWIAAERETTNASFVSICSDK